MIKLARANIFPDDWKLARVTPIFKKGKKDDMDNYRPISVISVVAKIFEKLIFEQLYEYLNNNNLIAASQSGFRPLHSTLTALMEATDKWSINIDNGLLNGVIFIDLKKAFDTIDQTILLQKLQMCGVDQNGIKFFESYLSNRSQRCCVNGELSDAVKITCGVPQGSNLGPLLFLIYINDLPNCLKRASPRMFADDTNISIAAKSVAELDLMINSEMKNLHQWLITNRLSLNVAKTKFMIIGSRQRLLVHNDHISIEIDGKAIERVYETKSLGLQIDEHLTWARHVENVSKKIASAIGALKRVRQFIDTDTALKIYIALIQPYFDYCSAVWDGLNITLNDKLQKLQNRAARIITKSRYDTSSSELFGKLGWDNLLVRRKKHRAILMFKTVNDLTPHYLRELFQSRSTGYNLRNSENTLFVAKPRTNYGKRSFSYSGAVLWNELPQNMRAIGSLNQFKREIDNLFS